MANGGTKSQHTPLTPKGEPQRIAPRRQIPLQGLRACVGTKKANV